jgi:RNA polymerase sigma-70 factor (ECF subfamily)
VVGVLTGETAIPRGSLQLGCAAGSLDELWGLARKGDGDAFWEVFERCGRHARRLLLSRLGAQEAEDAVQDVFVRALVGLPAVRGSGHACIAGWLVGIAHNYAVDVLRARGRMVARLEPRGLEIFVGEDEPADAAQARELGGVECNAEFDRIVGWLPEAQRQVLGLRYRLGFDDARVANALGKSELAVRLLAHRGLRSLRARHPVSVTEPAVAPS